MELQWPLILFTTFVAWCAGLFATQGILAIKGEGRESQMTAWIVSAVLLVVGGISVFFHLEHWERIFNGFGHITSGITQELIAIVLLAVVAVIFLVFLRKSDDEHPIPKWVGALAVVFSVILLVVMAHSYMMPSRPVWDSVLWILFVLGNACVLGPATMAVILSMKGEECSIISPLAVGGSLVNAVATVLYTVGMQLSGGSFAQIEYYYDPTEPMKKVIDPAVATNVFGGDQMALVWIGIIVIGALAPLALSAIAAKGKATVWKVYGVAVVVAGLVGAICMRVLFYELGISFFLFY